MFANALDQGVCHIDKGCLERHICDVIRDEQISYYKDLGSRVRRAREAADMTQAELAAHVGLTRSSVANLEAGRQHSPVHLVQAVAAATGIALIEILPKVTTGAVTPLDDDVLEALDHYDADTRREVHRLVASSRF